MQAAHHHFKIASLGIKDKAFNGMPFGRQIEYLRGIQLFKATAKSTYFSQKGTTFSAGLKKFLKLYDVKEYYCVNRNGPNWKDDSTEIWYTN